jgi:hypothetical protein
VSGLDVHPRIHYLRAIRAGDNRIEVELGDLGKLVSEPGDPQQQVLQGGKIGRAAGPAYQAVAGGWLSPGTNDPPEGGEGRWPVTGCVRNPEWS